MPTEEEPDVPPFPEHLIASVRKSKFHVIENRDISDDQNLKRLLLYLFNFPERSFYLFVQKHASLTEPLRRSVDREDILIAQTDAYYFRHPKNARDFISITPGSEMFDWEREVSSTAQEYLRHKLVLSQRTHRAMSIDQQLGEQSRRAASPLKLEPNLWGVGIDLRKAWAWLKTLLRSNNGTKGKR